MLLNIVQSICKKNFEILEQGWHIKPHGHRTKFEGIKKVSRAVRTNWKYQNGAFYVSIVLWQSIAVLWPLMIVFWRLRSVTIVINSVEICPGSRMQLASKADQWTSWAVKVMNWFSWLRDPGKAFLHVSFESASNQPLLPNENAVNTVDFIHELSAVQTANLLVNDATACLPILLIQSSSLQAALAHTFT